MLALDAFCHLGMRSFHNVNEALLVLLPMIEDASMVCDYRPIWLIYCVGKLFAKVLACRLAPHLGN
jgi:hypothetical protein